MSQIPLFALETPSQHPVIALVDSAGVIIDPAGAGGVTSVDGQTGAVDLSGTYGEVAAPASVSGLWTFTTLPAVNDGTGMTGNDPVNVNPGDPALALWQVKLTGPGRIFHITTGSGTAGASLADAIGVGVDGPDSNGILVSNKSSNSRGIEIHNEVTTTTATSWGLKVVNYSTSAQGVYLEQISATAKEALRVVNSHASPGAGQKLVTFYTPTLAEFGTIFADTGVLHWLRRVNLVSDGTNAVLHIRNNANAVTSFFNTKGYYITQILTAPLDADLSANQCALWFDPTNGAAKLMIKAKQADGTVRTGSVSLA